MKKNERLLIHLRSSVTEYALAKSHAQMSDLSELLELREAYGQISGYDGVFGSRKSQALRAMPSEGLPLSDVGIAFTGSS